MINFVPMAPAQSGAALAVSRDSFTDAEGSAEGAVIADLVREITAGMPDNDAQGFVALDGGDVIAAIFFTPLAFDNIDGVMMLSPVAVSTARQGEGVGAVLIRTGLDTLAAQGVGIAITYGDPAYYGRFGFAQVSPDVVQPPQPLAQPHGWQVASLRGEVVPNLKGKARCIAPFDKPELW